MANHRWKECKRGEGARFAKLCFYSMLYGSNLLFNKVVFLLITYLIYVILLGFDYISMVTVTAMTSGKTATVKIFFQQDGVLKIITNFLLQKVTKWLFFFYSEHSYHQFTVHVNFEEKISHTPNKDLQWTFRSKIYWIV